MKSFSVCQDKQYCYPDTTQAVVCSSYSPCAVALNSKDECMCGHYVCTKQGCDSTTNKCVLPTCRVHPHEYVRTVCKCGSAGQICSPERQQLCANYTKSDYNTKLPVSITACNSWPPSCPAGKGENAGSRSRCPKKSAEPCSDCPLGMFGDGVSYCKYCPNGKFQDVGGSQTCKVCPAGFATRTEGDGSLKL